MVTATEIGHGTYTFTRYVRLVLPADGYVFWVRANLVAPTAQYNAIGFNQLPPIGGWTQLPPDRIEVRGTVHYATEQHQDSEKVYASNTVHFNTMEQVQFLNAIDPATMWICTFDGIRFAFSSRENFFAQAGEYHYVGQALYSSMQTQIIDTVGQLQQTQVVSNSLPIWLSMNGYSIFYGIQTCPVVLYPSSSQLLDNLPPPFGVVHVVPDSTTALGSTPVLDNLLSHTQLARDIVRVTLYGTNNNSSADFVDFVNQFSLDNDTIGVMNMPILRDEKEAQPELLILAKKKSIEYEVSYYQSRARNIARQIITQAIPTFVVGPQVAAAA